MLVEILFCVRAMAAAVLVVTAMVMLHRKPVRVVVQPPAHTLASLAMAAVARHHLTSSMAAK
jgi:hypothetical protein